MPQPQNELHKLIAQTDPAVMKNVDAMLMAHRQKTAAAPMPGKDHAAPPAVPGAGNGEGAGNTMDDQAHAAMKAIARIASPFKGKIPPELMHNLIDAAGFEKGEAADPAHDEMLGDASHQGDGSRKEAGFMAIPEKIEGEEDDVLKGWDGEEDDEEDEGQHVKKSHVQEAAEKAHAVYKEHMEKAGYKKYPEAKMHMKTKDGNPVKEKGEQVSKSATAPNLATVDPQTRQKVEEVFKSNKELVKKNAELEARIVANEAKEREKEIVAKAASFTHVALPQEAIVEQLKIADKAGKESYEKVAKNFETLNEQAKESKLFSEFGSNQPAVGSSSASDNAWMKIEKAAEGYVAKSGEKLSKAESVDKFLQTAEGQRMYAEFKSGRKDGI